jgi:hypothetical protein
MEERGLKNKDMLVADNKGRVFDDRRDVVCGIDVIMRSCGIITHVVRDLYLDSLDINLQLTS